MALLVVLAATTWTDGVHAEGVYLVKSGESILIMTPSSGALWIALPTNQSSFMDPRERSLAFLVADGSEFKIFANQRLVTGFSGTLQFQGGLTLVGPGGKQTIPVLGLSAVGYGTQAGSGRFELVDVHTGRAIVRLGVVDIGWQPGAMLITSDSLSLTPEVARSLGLRPGNNILAGSFSLRVLLEPVDGREPNGAEVEPLAVNPRDVTDDTSAGSISGTSNPDVIVGVISGNSSYGTENGISAFAFGTTSCNIGTDPLLWIASNYKHPVISQNVLRYKDNRFEHIGQSWLKHGFFALQQTVCCTCCQASPDGSSLGVGCSDPYTAGLNGNQSILGPKHQVNAHTGWHLHPVSGVPPLTGSVIQRRMQIHNDDLDPALNEGATYFVEALYITEDDALAGNGNNNASYRRVRFSTEGDFLYNALLDAATNTRQQDPGILAWKEMDPTVTITEMQVPGEGLFILGAKAWQMNDGWWAYEYAIENLNSHRSGGSFTISIRAGDTPRNLEFHDVDYHSGEPYSGTDWTATINSQSVTWATDDVGTDENANALRWGTIYSFHMESIFPPSLPNGTTAGPPSSATATIGLFRRGFPETISARTIGPIVDMVDCNENGIGDACDISCDGLECVEPCGTFVDCDSNGVLDICQADCNENGRADPCDIEFGFSTDCNDNAVPDDCEPDCDDNGIIDDCDVFEDCDQDGIFDCFDLCPCSTGVNGCVCPDEGECCVETVVCFPFPWRECLKIDGVPDCIDTPCRGGCLVSEADGDFDRDLDVDSYDFAHLAGCFTSDFDKPTYTAPSVECAVRFDFDGDNDIDLLDIKTFLGLQTGPENVANNP